MMFDIMNGKENLTPQNKKYRLMNFQFFSEWGSKFRVNN